MHEMPVPIPTTQAEAVFPVGTYLMLNGMTVRVVGYAPTTQAGGVDSTRVLTALVTGEEAHRWTKEEALAVLGDVHSAALHENPRAMERHLRVALPLLNWLHVRMLAARKLYAAEQFRGQIDTAMASIARGPTEIIAPALNRLIRYTKESA
jgi:hypothetical protein